MSTCATADNASSAETDECALTATDSASPENEDGPESTSCCVMNVRPEGGTEEGVHSPPVCALVSMMGPHGSIAVPDRPAQEQAAEPGLQQDAAELAAFIAVMSAPITRQDQFYVATIDQHIGRDANPLWLKFRVGRCTGSAMGSIHGVNKYCSRKKQLEEMLCPSFKGNCMTEYGTAHEDDAQACFSTWQSLRLMDEEEDADGFLLEHVELENFGLCICRAFPPFAMSPDGFLVETWAKRIGPVPLPQAATVQANGPAVQASGQGPRPNGPAVQASGQGPRPNAPAVQASGQGPRPNGTVQEVRPDGTYAVKTKRILVEYKCPWGKRAKTWYDDGDVYALENIAKANGLVLPVPSYYFAQCSYGMHVLGVLDDLLSEPEYTYFVVWHPATHAEPYPDCWVAENAAKTSVTVAGEHGTIQVTRVPYLRDYCCALEESARKFWTEEYAPGLWRKLKYGTVASEPEELDFDKQSFVAAPRQRTLEECLSAFSTVGTFCVSGGADVAASEPKGVAAKAKQSTAPAKRTRAPPAPPPATTVKGLKGGVWKTVPSPATARHFAPVALTPPAVPGGADAQSAAKQAR